MRKRTTGWFTPYILNPANIEKVVGSRGHGVYVLGNLGPNKKLMVQHIKSGGDVKRSLRESLGKYQIFMYKPFRFQLKAVLERQDMLEYA